MAPSGVRLALIDDDSGLVAVLDRRLGALGWQREVLATAPHTTSSPRCACTR